MRATLPRLPPADKLPKVQPVNTKALNNPPKDRAQFTWLGHASVLLQVNGVNILFDPIFSDRCSPSQIAGPKRFTKAPCQVADLPPIDIVVISHNQYERPEFCCNTHTPCSYDHLDENTLKALGTRPVYFVPLGNRDLMLKFGCKDVVEADWWDEFKVGDILVACTPCQHFRCVRYEREKQLLIFIIIIIIFFFGFPFSSGRWLDDRNRTLWSSWVVKTEQSGEPFKFFFGGDTGYRTVPRNHQNNLEAERALNTCPIFKGTLLQKTATSNSPVTRNTFRNPQQVW